MLFVVGTHCLMRSTFNSQPSVLRSSKSEAWINSFKVVAGAGLEPATSKL